MPKTWQDTNDKVSAYDRIASMLKSDSDTDKSTSDHELLDNIRSEVFTDE